MVDWKLNNEYFMKFCDETKSENCLKKQCQYKIFCSKFKHLKIKEKQNEIKNDSTNYS